MAYEKLGGSPLEYYPCSYGASRLMVRGPKRSIDEDYIAFLGGTETYGKFIERPFAGMLEDMTEVQCLNLGVPNAGVDSFMNDATLLEIASNSRLTVVQVLGAQNLSNRYYSVHPRRNDRFLSASESMQSLFPDVDFTEFHFTNHMLLRLFKHDPKRFMLVVSELRNAWVARMKILLDRIMGPKVLLWFADHDPDEKIGFDNASSCPFSVTTKMLADVKSRVDKTVIVKASAAALARGYEGMRFSPYEVQAALQLLGPAAHMEAAFALKPVVDQYIAAV